MKFKTKVKREEVIEIEINFPAFFKSAAYNVKVISEKKAIWVINNVDIQTLLDPSFHVFGNTMFEPSTPEEFNAALEAAINHINELNK